MSDKNRNALGEPIIRISDDENKIIAIVDLHCNDRPSIFVKDIKKGKIIVIFI